MSEKHTDIAVMQAAAQALNESAITGKEALSEAAYMLLDGAPVADVILKMAEADEAYEKITGGTNLTLCFVVELVSRFAGASKKDDRQQRHISNLEATIADLQHQLAVAKRDQRALESEMGTAVDAAWQTGITRGFEQAGMSS